MSVSDIWKKIWSWSTENAPFLAGTADEVLRDKPTIGTLPVYTPYTPGTTAPTVKVPTYSGYTPSQTAPKLNIPAYSDFKFDGVAPTLNTPTYEKYNPVTALPEDQQALIDKIFSPYAAEIQAKAKEGAQRATGAAAARGAYGQGSASAANNMVQSIAAKENQELISNKASATLEQLDVYNQMMQSEHAQKYQADVTKAIQDFNAANNSYQFAYQMAYQQNKDKYYAEVDAAYKTYQVAWNNYQQAVTMGQQDAIARYQSEVTAAQSNYEAEYNKWVAENNIAETENYRKYQADMEGVLQKYNADLTSYNAQSESVSKILGYLQQNKENSKVKSFLEELGESGLDELKRWFEETTGSTWDDSTTGDTGGGTIGETASTIGEYIKKGVTSAASWLGSAAGIATFLGVGAPIAATLYAWFNRTQGDWKVMSPDELAAVEYVKYIANENVTGNWSYNQIKKLEEERDALKNAGYPDEDRIAEYDRQIKVIRESLYSTQFTPKDRNGVQLSDEDYAKFLKRIEDLGLSTSLLNPRGNEENQAETKTGAEMEIETYLNQYNKLYKDGMYIQAALIAAKIHALGGKLPGEVSVH